MKPNFHISLPCLGIKRTYNFYMNILGANIGRQTNQWIDVNLFGNQLTFVKSGDYNFSTKNYKFESKVLPSFHFGIILDEKNWNFIYEKSKKSKIIHVDKSNFLETKTGEHSSFFVKDPNGYIIEFKHFKDTAAIFS